TKDRIRVRRVFLRKPSIMPNLETQEQKDEAKQKQEAYEAKVAEVKKRLIDDKEPFADVAKEMSDDAAYKEQGGLMDWSELDNMDQSVVEALDGKDQDAIEQVDTPGAMLFVKLEGREAATTIPLEEKQDELARELMKQAKAEAVLEELVTELLAEAKETKSLTKGLEALKASEAPAERADEAPVEGGTAGGAADGADAPVEDAPKGKWAGVEVRTTGLFNMDIKQPPNMFGGQLPPELLAQLASWDRVPGLGSSKEIMLAAFGLSEEDPVSETVYEVTGDKVLIALKERKDPEEDTADDDSGISQVQREKIELASVLKRQAQLPTVGGEWSDSLFLYGEPVLGGEYGPWLEGMYKKALEEGRVKLNENAAIATPLLEEDLGDLIAPSTPSPAGEGAKEEDAKGAASKDSDKEEPPTTSEEDAEAK
ncbi:MAG: peptidylprolyl isomerase, partial [Myxococcota bacterium]